jgi:hypothetical protein
MGRINFVVNAFSQVRVLVRYMTINLSCLIAVSPGYSVFRQILNYLNSLKAIWGLNHLDLSGYNKIKPDVTHFDTHFANLVAFRSSESLLKAHEGPLSTPNHFFTLHV